MQQRIGKILSTLSIPTDESVKAHPVRVPRRSLQLTTEPSDDRISRRAKEDEDDDDATGVVDVRLVQPQFDQRVVVHGTKGASPSPQSPRFDEASVRRLVVTGIVHNDPSKRGRNGATNFTRARTQPYTRTSELGNGEEVERTHGIRGGHERLTL